MTVASRKIAETTGTCQISVYRPNSMRIAATRYVPDAIAFVQLYAVTCHPQCALCGTSEDRIAAVTLFFDAGWPDDRPACWLHMNSPPSGRCAASGSSVA